MPTPNEIAARYIDIWNQPSQEDRLRLLDGWTADALYRDPLMQAQGRADIAGMIETARSHFPGHSFALRGTPDGHGPFIRFSWDLAPENGKVVGGGTDIVRLDASGAVLEVIGFLDEVA